MAQTKRHFLNIRDQLVTNGGQWVNSMKSKRDKLDERERLLREHFIKQYDSTALDREQPSPPDVEFIRVNGTVRNVHLDARIDEGAVSFNRDALKQYWQCRLSTVVDIQQSVTKTGIQMYHVNENHLLHTFVKPFLRIVYGRHVHVSVNSLEQCCRVYGIDIAVNATVKKLLRPKTESTTTTVIRQRDDDGDKRDDVGIIIEK